MNCRMEVKESFSVLGKSIRTTPMSQDIGRFWMECCQNGTYNTLMSSSQGKCPLGLCYNCQADDSFDYMVGVEYSGPAVEGMELLNVPKATYAVFECKSDNEGALTALWTRLMNEWLPNSEYRHAGTPDMEVYYQWDCAKKIFHTEVWIPVVPKK